MNFGPGGAENAFAALHAFRPTQPLMSGEYWAGWFDQWGQPHARTNGDQQAREIDWMLSQGGSFSLYMFHGGTTFGFMNGANLDRGYKPQVTSYDYDAALDESGRPRPKYFTFRDAIARHFPGIYAAGSCPSTPRADRDSALDARRNPPRSGRRSVNPSSADRPKTMEELGQSYGYILYRTKLPARGGVTGDLVLTELHDYAEVFVNRPPRRDAGSAAESEPRVDLRCPAATRRSTSSSRTPAASISRRTCAASGRASPSR